MTKNNAENILRDEVLDFDVTLMPYSEKIYEIRVGMYESKESAQRIADALNKIIQEL